jgi:hypothetical protein
MNRAITTIATIGPIVFFAFAACAWDPEVDQIAQQKMIGLSKQKILACIGAPAKRARIGSTDIWTYPIGDARVESPLFSPALDMGASALMGADNRSSCNVNVVMTNGRVTQVVYHGADGGTLPLGRQCLFAVQNCTESSALKAAY